MNAWDPKTDQERTIKRVAHAVWLAEPALRGGMWTFFDTFSWDGKQPPSPLASDIKELRPQWTDPRILRMANAAIEALNIHHTTTEGGA